MERSPEHLSALPDGRFMELVTEHLRPNEGDPELWKVLLSRDLIDRTTAVLKAMQQRAISAADRKEAEANEAKLDCLREGTVGRAEARRIDAEWKRWKARNGHFQQLVVGRLAEAKLARRSGTGQVALEQAQARKVERLRSQLRVENEQSQHYREAIRRIALRVHQHQALTAARGNDPEQHDYDLWRLLDEITVPLSGPEGAATLRSMLRTHWFQTTEATVVEGQRGQTERLMRQAPAGRSPRYEGVPKVRRVDEPKRLA